MGEHSEAFVGIDVAKGRNAIAVADGERGGEVRYLGRGRCLAGEHDPDRAAPGREVLASGS